MKTIVHTNKLSLKDKITIVISSIFLVSGATLFGLEYFSIFISSFAELYIVCALIGIAIFGVWYAKRETERLAIKINGKKIIGTVCDLKIKEHKNDWFLRNGNASELELLGVSITLEYITDYGIKHVFTSHEILFKYIEIDKFTAVKIGDNVEIYIKGDNYNEYYVSPFQFGDELFH